MNTIATSWDVRNSTQENLVAFADIMAEALKTNLVPVQDALVPLHHAALELNRRHRDASLQDDFLGAVETLADFDRYSSESDCIAPAATLCAIRAAGAVLDLGTDEQWIGLGWAGYTREGLTYFLQCYAGQEHQRRGYKLTAPAVAVLVPADADEMVAPF